MELKEEIPIKKVFRLGMANKKDRLVKVKLSDISDKGKIFKNASNLKGKANARRKLYFVNDDLDAEDAEQSNQYRQLLKEKKNGEHDLEVKMVRRRLIVNNMIIRPKIRPPTGADVLRLSDEEREAIEHVKLVNGGEHSERNSDYYVYVQKVRSEVDVQKGYLKTRMRHGDATHISVVYRFNDARGPFNQEGIDDGEHGAGRAILNVLKAKSIVNVAVYVVRYYGGTRLGKRRFQILETLAVSGIVMYQAKARNRSNRMERALSQESLASLNTNVSELSYEAEPTREGDGEVVHIAAESDTSSQQYKSAEEEIIEPRPTEHA